MRISSLIHPTDKHHGSRLVRRRVVAMTTALAASTAALATPLAVADLAAAEEPSTSPTVTVDRIFNDRRITESSGLASSTYRPRVLLTHNDSGDRARLFAVGTGGKTRAVLTLANASAYDWEDVATGPGNTVWVGDIGDNARSRSSITVYRAQEPRTLASQKVPTTRYRFQYPDRARDAEALMVHPTTGRLYIVTKSDYSAGIYEAPATLSTTRVNTLRRVASAPDAVTAAAFAPDGSSFVLGTYTAAYLYSRPDAEPTRIELPARQQGESLEVTADGRLLVGSEGRNSPVHAVTGPFGSTTDGDLADPTVTVDTPDTTVTPDAPDTTVTPGVLDPTVTDDSTELAGWTLDLDEDFDTLDSTRWSVRNNTYSSNEHSYLLARNTTTEDGVLRIQGKLESAGGRNYTSGYVDTNRKYSVPDYFRAEVRAKVPMEQGMWAAPLWFRPADYSGGEIDLIETYGRERDRPLVHQTIHTDYGASHQQSVRTFEYSRLGDATGTQWHTYTVEKTPGQIVMWVDGVKTATFRSGDPSWFDTYYEAGKRWNLRVNLQIGGSWGGLPDASTDWSPEKTAMQVDYIRTWTPR